MDLLKLNKKQCLEEIKRNFETANLLSLEKYKYRMFKYGEFYHYMDNCFYDKKDFFDRGVKGRPEYNDVENHKNVIIVDSSNVDKLLKECG